MMQRKQDQYSFTINVELNGLLIGHYNQTERLDDEKHLQKIEKAVAADIQKRLDGFVSYMQEEIRVDCIDINKYAIAKWHRDIKDKVGGEEFISKADIEVKVKVNLESAG